MKNVFRLLILSIAMLVFIGIAVFAQSYHTTGNPNDTATGKDITAYATNETLSYKSGGATMPTLEVSSGDETYTTTSEFGYSGPGSPPDLSVTPGDIVTHEYDVTHEGNANDPNFSVSAYYTQEAGAVDWIVEMWLGAVPSFHKTLEAGVVTTETAAFNDDSDSPLEYHVLVPSDVAKAPNGSSIITTTTWETTSRPTNEYTGGNYLTYGGWSSATDDVTDEVAAPVLVLTRVSTVDSPITYSGGRHDAVPGAVITFTMTYSNEGSSSAESVVLVDKIPMAGTIEATKLAHVNNTGTTTYVTIEASQGNATGWTVYYSTLDSPAKTYEATAGWTLIGTLETGSEKFPGSGLTYLDSSPEAGAKWIKWEKTSIDAAEDGKKLTWGVTIR